MAKSAAAARGYIAKEAATPPSLEVVTTAIANLQKGYDDFKKENDAKLAVLEKTGKLDPLIEEKVNKASDAVGALQKQLDEITKQLNRPTIGGEEAAHKKSEAEYRKAFGQFFRRGERYLDENQEKALEERKSLSVGGNSGADGGYTAPQELDLTILNVIKEFSPMRNLATVVTVGAMSYRKLVNDHGTASGWVGETDARTETNASTFRPVDIPTGEIYANPAATQSILDDSQINIEEWLANEVAAEFATQEGASFISGNGTNKPKGVLGETFAAQGSQTLAQIGYVATGAAGAFASSNPSDKILDLIYALKAGYRANGQFVATATTIAAVRKLKDGQGNYLWEPSGKAGEPATLLGYAMNELPDWPAIAANAYALAFGDWKRGYLITDRIGIRVLRDPYTAKPYVMFYTTKRVGGRVVMHEAIKALKFAAS